MILIGLGSNLGARTQNLAAAIAALVAYDCTLVAASGVVETLALLPPGAPSSWDMPYCNQVIRITTALPPHALLLCLKAIESDLGREPGRPRWAPREIDLDLLAYEDRIIVDDLLTLPHPALEERRFVLAPLCEIAPQWIHPVLGQSARQLLARLGDA